MTADTNGWFGADSATFGDRLAAAREAANMSQADLARRLGVKTSTLRGWEDDQSEPRANRLQMLSGLLAVSLPWLLTGDGEGVEPPSDAPEISGDVVALLTELRDIRTDLDAKVGRLAVLEKMLRSKLKEEI